MVQRKYISKEFRSEALSKLLKLLSARPMGLTELVACSNYSRGFVNKLMKELEDTKKAYRTVEGKRRVWAITEKGKHAYLNDWTELNDDISDIVKNDGSYIRLQGPFSWPIELSIPSGVITDIALGPKSLEQTINFIDLESEIKKEFLKYLINHLGTDNDTLPQNSRLLLALQIDLSQYSRLLHKLTDFRTCIMKGAKPISETNLEFKKVSDKLELLYFYLTNAEIIEEDKAAYYKALDSFLTVKNIEEFAPNLNIAPLKKFISLYENSKDPLDDKKLIKDKTVISQHYEYAMAAAILSFKNKKLRNGLKRYAIQNRFDADSKLHKLEKEKLGVKP